MHATILASHILYDGSRLQLVEIGGGVPPVLTRYELTIARGTRSTVIDAPYSDIDNAMLAWRTKVSLLSNVNAKVTGTYL